MKKTLERIPAAHLPQMIQQARPAITADLFRGLPIERIMDQQKAREILGNMKVTMSLNYIDGHLERIRCHLRGVPMPPKLGKTAGTFAGYLDLIAQDPDTRTVISEEPTPECLLKDVSLSEFGVDSLIAGNPAPFAEVPPTTAYSLIFAANRGNSSDMHADGDGRDVLLYQGFGRKRVILFPPESAPYLHPIANFSTVRIAGMSDADREAFVTYAGGVEHTLLPGEAIFMPAFVWHHFDYLDPSLSVIFRFGGITDPDAKAVLRAVHLDQHVQNILAGTRDPARAQSCRAAAQRLLSASKQKYKGTQDKYRVMRRLAAECHLTTRSPDFGTYSSGIVEAEDFLDGALSGAYSRPPTGSAMRRWLWTIQERTRDRLRRWGRKLSFWA
jgi:hypothetical protein